MCDRIGHSFMELNTWQIFWISLAIFHELIFVESDVGSLIQEALEIAATQEVTWALKEEQVMKPKYFLRDNQLLHCKLHSERAKQLTRCDQPHKC